MHWFKHHADARNDEKLAALEDRAGLEGYGFYFKMLEIVAEIMGASDTHERTYSLTRWGRQTNITSKKYLFLLQCCSDVGLMSFCRDGDNITVKIPKLLKIKDEYSKKSGQHPDKLRIPNKELELDLEKELELESPLPPFPVDNSEAEPVGSLAPGEGGVEKIGQVCEPDAFFLAPESADKAWAGGLIFSNSNQFHEPPPPPPRRYWEPEKPSDESALGKAALPPITDYASAIALVDGETHRVTLRPYSDKIVPRETVDDKPTPTDVSSSMSIQNRTASQQVIEHLNAVCKWSHDPGDRVLQAAIAPRIAKLVKSGKSEESAIALCCEVGNWWRWRIEQGSGDYLTFANVFGKLFTETVGKFVDAKFVPPAPKKRDWGQQQRQVVQKTWPCNKKDTDHTSREEKASCYSCHPENKPRVLTEEDRDKSAANAARVFADARKLLKSKSAT